MTTDLALINLPGKPTATSWALPAKLSYDDWIKCGQALMRAESGVQWWLGDWWAFGEHAYGERTKALDEGGPLEGLEFKTIANYAWVARAIETSRRREVLSFKHHVCVAALPPRQQEKWLARAAKGDGLKPWSSGRLKAAIAQSLAISKTKQVELDARRLGKFVVLYADPPWRYENPPMGGTNRSIERHYPTMELGDICALNVSDLAHEHAMLFLWATAPKLPECLQVAEAWGFECRTNMVWDKMKIGMGYHVRNQHELLLICKRGELPPPQVEARPASVLSIPRGEHSAKPHEFYDVIDAMYPGVRKLELFARDSEGRKDWSYWGNQSEAAE